MARGIVWCDAEANCRRLSSQEGVADVVEKAASANVGVLIVDVKPLCGEVLYRSKYAPRLGEVNGFQYPSSFDLLEAMIEEGHKRGICVHAAINVFSEANRQWRRGPAYTHPEWQTVTYEAVRIIDVDGKQITRTALIDPWTLPSDASAIYTTKSGPSLSTLPGRGYLVIRLGKVTEASAEAGVDLNVPSDGCIVTTPGPISGIKTGDEVSFHVEEVFRTAQDSDIPSWGVFTNPIGPARKHELEIIGELASGYGLDGLIFDRMRYPNVYADFSETSRMAFEKWLGRRLLDWPHDIFTIAELPWQDPLPGDFYKEWLEWRAWEIRGFAEQATCLARSIKPALELGVYVGSWYDYYYDVGVNWGSRNFHGGHSWMTPDYNLTGFAELFDYICTGCYYPHPTREDAKAAGRAECASVEAACEVSRTAIGSAARTYGSIYLRDYMDNLEGFRKAVKISRKLTNGAMLFDLVYLEEYGWWEIVKELFGGSA